MTALSVALALVVGLLSSEILARCLRQDAWAVRRFAAMRDALQRFHAADNDDARQRYLIRGGMATLTLSLVVLAAVTIAGVAFAAPMVLLEWNATDSTVYGVVAGIVAIAWWHMRRPRAT
jgi:hypothetical protein